MDRRGIWKYTSVHSLKILKTLEMDTFQQPLPFWVKEGFIPKKSNKVIISEIMERKISYCQIGHLINVTLEMWTHVS